MGKSEYPGEFEQMVLLALMRLQDEAYGVTIHEELTRRTGRDVRRGAIYVTLDRLENKGYVSSEYGEPSAERGGRSKRFYRVTPEGRELLRRSREALQRLWQGIEPELEGA